jgi:hypothetical protein
MFKRIVNWIEGLFSGPTETEYAHINIQGPEKTLGDITYVTIRTGK